MTIAPFARQAGSDRVYIRGRKGNFLFSKRSVSDRKKREYRLTLNAQSYMMVLDG
jgi:hypothetical protein